MPQWAGVVSCEETASNSSKTMSEASQLCFPISVTVISIMCCKAQQWGKCTHICDIFYKPGT